VAAIVSLLVMVAVPQGLEAARDDGGRLRRHDGPAPGPFGRRDPQGWSPFALASVFIFLWALPSFNSHLKVKALTFPTPGLDGLVIRTPPVVPAPVPEPATIDFNFFALPGTAVFLGAFLAAPMLGMRVSRALALVVGCFRQLVPSMLAISFMVGLAYVTKYAGMDTVLGLSLTRTGWIYPFFGTLLGWLGVALTGTDAGSNALFGNLQKVTAEQLGISPVLMASANSAGGVMGKMIDAQSIVVASSAVPARGARGRRVPGRVLAQHRARLADRAGRAAVRVRDPVDHPGLKGSMLRRAVAGPGAGPSPLSASGAEPGPA
jgi:lactate permease